VSQKILIIVKQIPLSYTQVLLEVSSRSWGTKLANFFA